MQILTKMPRQQGFSNNNRKKNPMNNQDGSIIVIALMILAVMTIIGLMSSDTAVTENFIIRNTGIYKQNVNFVETVTMEGLQTFMQIPDDDSANFEIASQPWFNDRNQPWTQNAWYNPAGQLLDATNSLPTSSTLLNTRGEPAANLRYAFVGWESIPLPSGSESLVVSGKEYVWRRGRILTEYVSLQGGNDNGYGAIRMEVGVKRQIPTN